MPKYEIGPKVTVLGLAALVVIAVIVLAWLGETELAVYFIDKVTSTGMEVPAS